MFDDNENPVFENQVPSPPAPPQPAIKPTEPIVEPPPPTGENPHMDLPLTPKPPSPNNKVKIILASLAGLILLGAIGYGGWWAYWNYLDGDISNVMGIFNSADTQQEVVIETEEQETQTSEESEVVIESGRYEFNDLFLYEGQNGDELTMSGFTNIAEDQSTFNMSVHITTTLGPERTQSDIENTFRGSLSNGVEWPIFLVSVLNPGFEFAAVNELIKEAGMEVNSDFILSNTSIRSDYKEIFPNYTNSLNTAMNTGASLADLEFSMEIVQEDSIYPIYRFKFDDASDNVIWAIYNINGESKTTNISFTELLEIDYKTELLLPTSVIEVNHDAQRISDAKQLQTALQLYYVDNKIYPVSEEVIVLDNTLQICDDGFAEQSIKCTGSIYMGRVPEDPADGQYTYRSPIGTWYEMVFKLSESYTGDIGLQPGKNVATPTGIMPYGNPDEDEDGDGLINSLEEENGTDINNADSDSDGLSDYDEVIWWKTDPLNWDTDGDGFGDWDEINNGYDPLGEGRYFE